MRLVVLTAPEPQSEEIPVLHALFATGLERLHLRRPLWQTADFDTFLQEFSQEERRKIWIHRRSDLVLKHGLAGVHLSGLVADRQPGVAFSLSIHTLDELAALPSQQSAFLSPIFPSISKTGYAKDWDLPRLPELLRHHPNITALGGITPERLSQAADLGFHSAAVLGYLWNETKPSEIMTRWKLLQESC